jgi:hypothetical protein
MGGNKSDEKVNFEYWHVNRPLSFCVMVGVFYCEDKYG